MIASRRNVFSSGNSDLAAIAGTGARPIVVVEVPLSAFRLLFVGHEHVVLLAQIAIEEFQQQTLASIRVFSELFEGTVEVPVLADIQFQLQIGGGVLQLLLNSVVTRLNNNQLLRIQSPCVLAQHIRKRLSAIPGWLPLQFVVLNLPTLLCQIIAKVSHGGEEAGDAEFVAPNVSRFFLSFSHPDRVVGCVETVER